MSQLSFRLLPSLQFTPHVCGNRRWYAVEDPQSGRFLRLGTAEYLVASGLQNGIAPQQMIEVLTLHGFANPREHVTATIAWLAKQGLLISDAAPSNAGDRSPDGKKAAPPPPAAPAVFDPFFIRLPLLSGAIVERLAKPFTCLVSFPAVAVFVVLVIAALTTLFGSSTRFWALTETLFVEDGRLWWLVAWFVLKTAHEMGHAIAAVSAGSRIRSAGIHFIFLAPVPYVDVTDLWSVTNRRHRILVSSAGMLAEVAVAALAVLIAMASSNLAVQYLCAAVATLGTITTLAFNGNPLMKFDGYYILSDLLHRPNLWTEAQRAATAAIARLLNPFCDRPAVAGCAVGAEQYGSQLPLAAFGMTTMFYRMLMLLTMAWWLLSVWHGIGALVVAWAVWGWFVRPYWLKRAGIRAAQAAGLAPPAAEPTRTKRAQLAYWLCLAFIAVLVGWLPSPQGITAPGIVGYAQPTTVRSGTEGVLTRLAVSDRQWVVAGELIAELSNPELLVELSQARLQHQTALEQANALRARGELALLQAEQAKIESLAEHVEQLSARAGELDIRAPCAGMIVASSSDKPLGRFVKVGMPICMIVLPEQLEVCASASQRDAIEFQRLRDDRVAITAPAGHRCMGKLVSVDTRGSDHCEQPSLAANYGGPLAVEFTTDAHGEKLLQFPAPRFEIKAQLSAEDAEDWMPGQRVWIQLNERPQRVWQWAWEALFETLQSRANR
ncbi:MAG: site-2 protease family protein [Aureliella sp.]